MSLAFNLKSSKFIHSYSSMTKLDVCDLIFTSRKSCIFLFAFCSAKQICLKKLAVNDMKDVDTLCWNYFWNMPLSNIFISLFHDFFLSFKSIIKMFLHNKAQYIYNRWNIKVNSDFLLSLSPKSPKVERWNQWKTWEKAVIFKSTILVVLDSSAGLVIFYLVVSNISSALLQNWFQPIAIVINAFTE